MTPEDRDQANAALLLNEKINERVLEALLLALNANNTVAFNTQLPFPVTMDQVVVALMEHPHVKTRIYQQAAETARMLILQAFQEYSSNNLVPSTPYYTTTTAPVYGFVYSADSLPKQRFF